MACLGECHDTIPNGYEIFDINGDTEFFEKGKTDDDIRGGCLAYGFKRQKDTIVLEKKS